MFENPFHCIPQSSSVQTQDGENLLGGTPLVAWVDLLNAGMEGCVIPEEPEKLVAMSCLADDIPFSLNAGVTGLPIGKAGCSMSGSIV